MKSKKRTYKKKIKNKILSTKTNRGKKTYIKSKTKKSKPIKKKTKTIKKKHKISKFKGGSVEMDNNFNLIITYISKNNLDAIKNEVEKNKDILNYQFGENKVSLLQESILLYNQEVTQLLLDLGSNINIKGQDGVTALMLSVSNNFAPFVKLLLENGADINEKDDSGRTALFFAVQKKYIEILNILLNDRNIKIDEKDNNGLDALMYASAFGNKEALIILLNKDAYIKLKKDDFGRTALFYAIKYNNLEIVKILVKNGAETTIIDNNGDSYLALACHNGNTEIVKILLENGASSVINEADIGGLTPLLYATKRKHFDIIKLLVEHGADVNIQNKEGFTPLINSILYEDKKSVELLLKSGANVEQKKGFLTPLNIACIYGNMEIIELLLKNGADINTKNQYGVTPLIMSIGKKFINVVKLLIEKGANVNLSDEVGGTPLMYACGKNVFEIVELLVKNGANVNLSDNNGSTPLMFACQNKNFDIVKLLVEHGADVNIQNMDGSTALMYASETIKNASETINVVMVYFLLENGANPLLMTTTKNTASKIADNIEIKELLQNKAREILKKQLAKKENMPSVSSEGLSEELKKNMEEQDKIKNMMADINAAELIRKEEEEKIKKTSKKNKLLENKKQKEAERIQRENLQRQLQRENEERELFEKENQLVSEKEKYEKEQQLQLQELEKQQEIDRIFQEKVAQEERKNAELEEKLIKEAVEKSIETFNNEKKSRIEKDRIENEAFSFGEKYFGGAENIKIIKTEIENMELLKDNNAFEKLKEILPAYSNNFILKEPATNNIISLLFILIGILSNNLKDNGIYLMLKGGSAIQNVGSQVPNEFMVPYESNDIDIVLINTNNISNPDENKILTEQIANFLIWVTEENSNSILTQTTNIDTTHPIVKIILNKNKKPLVDLDYNILPDNILNLYMSDIYSKPFLLGQTSGLFYSPSIKSLIYERIYLMINYSEKEKVKVLKNKAFLTEKIPRSLNYLVKMLFILENERESNKDELKTFYGTLFDETFNFFGITKEIFFETHGSTIDQLIQMCIDQLPAMRTTFYNSKEDK
uniref:Uncharacterized protein n=1 Tax=viral metagenome TaxID=1070528 RepID=A0A6C0ED74_9ZZZZ